MHLRSSWILIVLAAAALNVTACRDAEIPEGAFVVLLDAHPKGLDPRFPGGDSSAKIMGLLHAGLVSTDTRTGAPELELAESITQRDPTTYDVVLRQNATFHDGAPVTSADVEYTFMELGTKLVNSPMAGIARRIERFEAHDARRFTVTLAKPHAPFTSELSMGIVPKHVCAGKAQCPMPPVGAGPFAFSAQYGDHTVILRAFDDYLLGRPAIDTLAFKVVKDDNTRLLALLGGAADLVQNAVAPLMLPVVQDQERLQVLTSESFKYTYLAFNLRKEVLRDVRVRQAIAHGIDREAIVRYKFRGFATLSTGMLAPGHWAYHSDVPTYDYDPERAMQLLDEAGYTDPDGPEGPKPRLTLELKVSSNKFRRALAMLMAHQLARIGIELRVRAYEWGTYFHDIKSGNFELTSLQWPSVLEPSLFRWVFHSTNIPTPERRSAGANRGAYVNPALDELLDAGMSETDVEKRAEIYAEVQRILARDLPYVSLWHEHNIAVLEQGTADYYTTPNARFEALKLAKPAKTP